MADIVIPSSPDDLKKIHSAIKETCDCMIRITAERELMKDIVQNMAEQFPDIPKKYFNKMAKVYYKNSFDKEIGEMGDFEQLYTVVTSVK